MVANFTKEELFKLSTNKDFAFKTLIDYIKYWLFPLIRER